MESNGRASMLPLRTSTTLVLQRTGAESPSGPLNLQALHNLASSAANVTDSASTEP